MKKRKRGGASFICPKCKSLTFVLRTILQGEKVQRHRECQRCKMRFMTLEVDDRNTLSSRYCVCLAGNGFSVEDRKTGERLSYHRTQGAAIKARKLVSDQAREEETRRRVS